MQSTLSYLIPEYYPDFKCKTSECRHPCCEGWNISISMKDYFRLVGADCSKELRAKLDCALKVTGGTEEGQYATICFDYTGRCRLHREDGLCAIQAELGEELLPSICRYYPRGVRHAFKAKCFCSNSCEAIIEMLDAMKKPLKFLEKQFAFDRIPDVKEIKPNEFTIQQDCMNIIQDRNLSLIERMFRLCDYLCGVSDSGKEQIHTDIAEALDIQHRFTDWFEANSVSIREFCHESQTYYGTEGKEILSDQDRTEVLIKFNSGKNKFAEIFPDWEILFENILVNHMFYEEFPYLEKNTDKRGSFISLAAVYSFLRYNAVGYCFQHPSKQSFFDMAAAMFRLIEHSCFARNARIILEKMNYTQSEKLKNLILL